VKNYPLQLTFIQRAN